MNILLDDEGMWLNKHKNMLELIEDTIKTTLINEKFSLDVEVSITLTDNKTIQIINRDYREIDAITDVLSFPQIDWFSENMIAKEYIHQGEGDILLGDIIISTERLEEQAAEYGHSLERECGFLIAHSMLHLLGYDHMGPQEEQEMFEKQEIILKSVGLER